MKNGCQGSFILILIPKYLHLLTAGYNRGCCWDDIRFWHRRWWRDFQYELDLYVCWQINAASSIWR